MLRRDRAHPALQKHKRRNVIEHLPEALHDGVNRSLRDAWSSPSPALAKKKLLRLAVSPEAQHPSAAASLKKGLDETLTVQGLGITGAMYKTLGKGTSARTSFPFRMCPHSKFSLFAGLCGRHNRRPETRSFIGRTGDSMIRARKTMTRFAAITAAAIALSFQVHAAQTTGWPVEVQKHLDAATAITNGDKFLVDNFRVTSCFEVEDPDWRTWARAQTATRVPLTQLFDNVWYIGDKFVGQYIVKTADGGVMLIDTLNNGPEAAQYTLPALQSLGLADPAKFRGVLLTHGHFDHDGGAAQLRATFGSTFPVYLGSGDVAGKPYNPTPIDSANPNPQTFTFGGTTIVVQSTAGHTPGSIVAIVPVQKKGVTYNMLLNWRAGIPATAAGSKAYLAGTERAYKLARQYAADGVIHTHPISDVTFAALSNPDLFMIGNETTLRAAAISRECSAARAAQLDATAQFSTWRVTKMAFLDKDPTSTAISARLSHDLGPIVSQQVQFKAEGSNATCVAFTNSDGVAICDMPALADGANVTAEFSGTESADVVNLPSAARVHVDPVDSGGCTIGNGRFDPLLLAMALLAGVGLVQRRKHKVEGRAR
jgi:glyoxylase-like metal-dependent hydrolase (beta-lactamase superfamily II)